ncbi:DNA polymerase alpha catalytic subunit [Cephus cinctus]|uniref:DNA polymerase n=1 Tax=Cephus cinctus TaxID=211228 RepID=A0AAJ7VYG1_CEPCN|nr:DNA polymerase alpha catalytic subunit [Cephus cinctus]
MLAKYNEVHEEPCLPGRSQRKKVDKHGRLSALEKLKQLKGNKHKYKINQLENIYDEVDEREYSKTVLKRQNDDWIIDDDGHGYIEDGREIFDDDLDDESIQQAAKHKESGPRKKKKEDLKKKGNIRSMFMNAPSKKEALSKIEDDTIFGELLSELKNESIATEPKKKVMQNKICTSSTPNVSYVDSKKTKREGENLKHEESAHIKKNATINKNKESIIDKESIITDNTNKNNIIDAAKQLNHSVESTSQKSKEVNVEHEMNVVFEECPGLLEQVDYCDVTDSKKPKDSFEHAKIMDDVDLPKQSWDNDFGVQPPNEVLVNLDTLPLITDEAGNKIFRFYWWDALEDPYKQPGVVFLFGKVYMESIKTHVSCSLMVKNIERRFYLLPREYMKCENESTLAAKQVSITDVYEEFNQYANKMGIKTFRSCKVSKLYAFDKEGVPTYSDYLEVRYSASYPPIDSNYTGNTFEHIFGSSVSALELLLIERNIKGPCWLDIKCPVPSQNSNSWCKIQVSCMKMENISVPMELQNTSPPPMVLATINIRTALNLKLQRNEILMVAILLHRKYQIDKTPPKPPFQQHICLVTHPRSTTWPLHARDYLSKLQQTKVICCETEYDLIEKLLELLNDADPDLLVGHDCAFQLDVLIHRIIDLKIPHWSRIGKLKRSVPPLFKNKVNFTQVCCGRPICDIQNSAKELNLKLRSFDLKSLCIAILHKKEDDCKEINPVECEKFYSSKEKLEDLLRMTMTEASYIITIMFELNVMPLALQLTCIAGNILSRTLSAGRAERNEFLLLHAFNKKGYITPDKRLVQNDKGKRRKKKAAYEGGLVLEPKKGFYDTLILLMDFNSLYPSIIQEYNLCFTTVPGAAYADSADLIIPKESLEPGIVPTEIRKLVESRVEIKKLMKSPYIKPELKTQYNIRQLALKLTANSMYGCLGATHCRFYAKGLAALVTAKGREILQNTKHLVERLNYEVIYGDTDSLMINTHLVDYDEVFNVGKKIKTEVNKLYTKVELDIDGVFRYLLLLQKKKYAAVTINKLPNGQLNMVQEHKGLDIVRRDWSHLACEAGRNILDQLFYDKSLDMKLESIHEILQNIAKSVREGQVPLSSLVITKQLSKNPEDYPDQKHPHVIVALRLNKKGGRMWKSGDIVPYIICNDGTNKTATERAYHIDEFKKNDTLKVDTDYYLMNQIFPVVLRICNPIQSIDDVLLAKDLGLTHIYKSRRTIHEEQDIEIPLSLNEDRYRYCVPFKFKCRNEQCLAEITLTDVLVEFHSKNQPALFACSNVNCHVPPWTYAKAIQNDLQLAIRNAITEYYIGHIECESPICGNVTRQMPNDFDKNYPKCDQCDDGVMHRIHSEIKLYNQFCFYRHMFNIHQPQYKCFVTPTTRGMISAYDALKEFVEMQLRRNAYSLVDLNVVFEKMRSNTKK